jgi:DNA (cytosine-5)-methyltransferase 1
MSTKINVVDLFSGIGGLSLGFENAGFNILGGVDNWETACLTYDYNHKSKSLCADLSTCSTNEILDNFSISNEDVHVVVGGPPCQGFSTIGNRNDEDPRNNLVFSYIKHVMNMRPHYFVMENVNGILLAKNRKLCEIVKDEVAKHGYQLIYKEVVSADYGVPQLRKRVIFVGWDVTLKPFLFPKPTQGHHTTVGDAILDLPALEAGESVSQYCSSPLTDYQRWARNGCTELHNHQAANHSKKLIEIISHIPDGGNRKSIPDHLQPKSGFHNSYARLDSKKPAIAVTSNMRKPSSARATHPKQNRGLTVREGLRLQSFKDDFIILGSRTDQYLQVGNAVPPLLGLAMGAQLKKIYEANELSKVQKAKSRVPEPVSSQDVQLSLVS